MLKYILTTLLTFFLFSYGHSAGPLDSIRSNSNLTIELKDVYKAYNINHKIVAQKELINLLLADESGNEIKDLLDDNIKECESLRNIQFGNDTLGRYISNYLKSTILSYQIAKSKGFKSTEFKSNYEQYKKGRDIYMDYLAMAYSTSRFEAMTEDNYWKIVNKRNYIRSDQYPRYEQLKKTNLKKSLILLDSISEHTEGFQEYVIYQIEIADQYVKHPEELNDLSDTLATNKYMSLLQRNTYCIYLFEAWLKWRTVLQQNNGLSKSSEIPNNEYDSVREQVAAVILKYIIKNPNDEMAINEFMLMATHDIVRRFGSYQYGNQNTVEYHEIFDEKK